MRVSNIQLLPSWSNKKKMSVQERAARDRSLKLGTWGSRVLAAVFVLFTTLSVVNVFQNPGRVETHAVTWLMFIPVAAVAYHWALKREKRVDALVRALYLAGGLFVGLFAYVFLWATAMSAPVGVPLAFALTVAGFLILGAPSFVQRLTLGGVTLAGYVVCVAFSPYVLVSAPFLFGALFLVDVSAGLWGVRKAHEALDNVGARKAAARAKQPSSSKRKSKR